MHSVNQHVINIIDSLFFLRRVHEMSEKPLILDGGLGTLLYSRGAFVKGDPLWSVRCLVSKESEGRRQLLQAHLDYLTAGADIIKTNSYQMCTENLRKCLPGLSQVGLYANQFPLVTF